jgi:uncharacterized membrane protein YkgB
MSTLPVACWRSSFSIVLLWIGGLKFASYEASVPALGDAHHGFPYLSGLSRQEECKMHEEKTTDGRSILPIRRRSFVQV